MKRRSRSIRWKAGHARAMVPIFQGLEEFPRNEPDVWWHLAV